MNISRVERRVLNALALGGRIIAERDDTHRIVDVDCVTREGWILSDCSLDLFKRLKAKRLIDSASGGPYRITRTGLEALRS
jgi:uncharacterized protein YjhX (UPF0386 family)